MLLRAVGSLMDVSLLQSIFEMHALLMIACVIYVHTALRPRKLDLLTRCSNKQSSTSNMCNCLDRLEAECDLFAKMMCYGFDFE